MARLLRLEFAGALYHVTARGYRRGKIHEDDGDREAFLSALANAVERLNWMIHAYCLVSNHHQLLIETLDRSSPRACANSTACTPSTATAAINT